MLSPRITFITILFCCLSYSLSAQLSKVFDENFDDPSKSWHFEMKDASFDVSEGQLRTQKTSEVPTFMLHKVFINTQRDYTVKSTFKINDTSEQYAGIVLACGNDFDKKSYYSFSINSKGYYKIASVFTNITVPMKRTSFSSYINKEGFNTLSIEKAGKYLYFKINKKKVFSTIQRAFSGFWQGIVIEAADVSIDNFSIYAIPTKINLVDNPIQGLKKEYLSARINSYAGELSPKVSADGSLLFVCRSDHRGNLGPKDGDQDAWVAERKADGSWGLLKNMGKDINDRKQNAIATISADKNTVFINYDGRDNPGLMMSNRTQTGWQKARRVQIDDFYNRDDNATFCMSPSGTVLLMSVDRKDSQGDTDLYVSFRKSDGSWSAPKTLGTTINTKTPEFGPYLAPDNRTLYFASYGHLGYGSADIFVSKRLDDTWTNWSTPQNLGPEVNTRKWDAYYTITASGKEAYMATAGKYGSTDIVRIQLKEEDNEESILDPVVLIKGRVLDQKTKQAVTATIEYQDLKTGKQVGIARSDPRTGDYQISLPYGVHYGVQAQAKSYVSVAENIDLLEVGTYQELNQNLLLAPIQVGETINMKNVFFETASAKLKPESLPELARIVQLMKNNPSLEIKIKGHTDSIGKADILLKLSQLRAKAVVDYLVQHRISPSRITWEGYGGKAPIADNRDEKNRYKNRRVEFEIVKFE